MPCPHVGCAAPIASAECELLLAGSADDVAMYRQVSIRIAQFVLPGTLAGQNPAQACACCLHGTIQRMASYRVGIV